MTDQVMVGDEVLIRARVTDVGPADVGYTVELFSKTDQYSAQVRPDLVERVLVAEVPDEPPDGTWLPAEEREYVNPTVFLRSDARAGVEPNRRLQKRWWDFEAAEWVDWPEAVRRGADPARSLAPVPERIGGHVREAAGYCRTHGLVHSPEEWERAAARAAAAGVPEGVGASGD